MSRSSVPASTCSYSMSSRSSPVAVFSAASLTSATRVVDRRHLLAADQPAEHERDDGHADGDHEHAAKPLAGRDVERHQRCRPTRYVTSVRRVKWVGVGRVNGELEEAAIVDDPDRWSQCDRPTKPRMALDCGVESVDGDLLPAQRDRLVAVAIEHLDVVAVPDEPVPTGRSDHRPVGGAGVQGVSIDFVASGHRPRREPDRTDGDRSQRAALGDLLDPHLDARRARPGGDDFGFDVGHHRLDRAGIGARDGALALGAHQRQRVADRRDHLGVGWDRRAASRDGWRRNEPGRRRHRRHRRATALSAWRTTRRRAPVRTPRRSPRSASAGRSSPHRPSSLPPPTRTPLWPRRCRRSSSRLVR